MLACTVVDVALLSDAIVFGVVLAVVVVSGLLVASIVVTGLLVDDVFVTGILREKAHLPITNYYQNYGKLVAMEQEIHFENIKTGLFVLYQNSQNDVVSSIWPQLLKILKQAYNTYPGILSFSLF